MAHIAVDAMGGDFAPTAPIAGALLALEALPADHQIDLVGQPAAIEPVLSALLSGEYSSFAHLRDRIEIVAAPDVIEMSEKPAAALRRKPESSMAVGIKRVASGLSQGFVSAGNTGAQMAISLMVLKLQPGLSRPAIGAVFPTAKEPVLVLDVGANVDCSAEELVQFAHIGTVYAQSLLGRENPSVGLLSVGEESEKGNQAVKEAHQRLLGSSLNFIGNVEGRDIPMGQCAKGAIDIVVCDGFTGNILLKFYEGTVPFLIGLVSKIAAFDPKSVMGSLRQFDPDEHGGTPLLGVRGVSIISHGASSPRAIKNAILVAIRAWESDMSGEIGRRLGVPASSVANQTGQTE